MTGMPEYRRHTAVLVGLGVLTVGAAPAVTSYDAHLGSTIWDDLTTDDQMLAGWRLGAIFAYTSGSVIGHICALLAGYLATRWWRPRAGLLAGSGIGVANLTASACVAVPVTVHLAGGPLFGNGDGTSGIDPALTGHPAVFAAMAATLAMAVILAICGSAVARLPWLRWLPLVALSVLVPVAHFVATMTLAANPEALGMVVDQR